LIPQAQKNFEHAMESSNKATYVPAFELFTMEVANRPANQLVKKPCNWPAMQSQKY